jgi:hypothetical protein
VETYHGNIQLLWDYCGITMDYFLKVQSVNDWKHERNIWKLTMDRLWSKS